MLKASTSREIEVAFASFMTEPADALFVAADGFFNSRRVQFATLAARQAIPTAHANRQAVEAGGLMSYGTDIADMFRQVGVQTGQILRARRRPNCRSCSQPNSTSSSICKLPERWASRYPTRSNRSPTR